MSQLIVAIVTLLVHL